MHFPPDPDSNSARSGAAVLLFVACCFLSIGRLVFQAPNPTRLSVDDIAKRSDQRFASLKARLPARGVIGYLGETGDSATPDYYLTQYALAPLVIDDSPNHAIVIGNFPAAQHPQFPQNLRLIEDFGDGVLLFANRDAN